MKEFYSIGEVARLKGTTVKTLRYYDEVGLLKPSFTNAENGYRYYTFSQLFTLEFILMLKNAGVGLKQIKDAFQSDDWLGVVALCEDQIQTAQEQLLRAQEAIFRFRNLSERIQADQINVANPDVYYRHFPARQTLMADCPYPPMHDLAYEIFTGLYQNVRKYNLTSFYSTGTVVSLDKPSRTVSYKKAYVEAYSNPFSQRAELCELPEGIYFCVTYSQTNREEQIQKLVDLLAILNKSPRLLLESDTFYTTRDYQNQFMELQALV